MIITPFVKKVFNTNNIIVPNKTMTYEELLKRPEITFKFLDQIDDFNFSNEVKEQVEIGLKYDGYIKKELKEAKKLQKLETKEIPQNINYDQIKNLASEARQKLKQVMPKTLAQASRISGVNPVDIMILSVYLKKEYSKNE